MDVRNLQYPSNTFDMIIDKSTIDALLCGDNAFMNVAKMMKVKFSWWNNEIMIGMPESFEGRWCIHGYFLWYTWK